MFIEQFIAYATGSKSHIYAVEEYQREFMGRYTRLQMVTTLSSDHVSLTDELIRTLNNYLANPTPQPSPIFDGQHAQDDSEMHELPGLMAQLPSAVATSIRRFLDDHCESRLGDFNCEGPIFRLTDYEMQLQDPSVANTVDDLHSALADPSDMISVRLESQQAKDDEYNSRAFFPHREWGIEARSALPYVAVDTADPSRWVRPAGITLKTRWQSWTVGDGGKPVAKPLREGLGIAVDAYNRGLWTRIHPVWVQWPDRWSTRNGVREVSGTTAEVGYVVEVFDAPIPGRVDDEDGSDDD